MVLGFVATAFDPAVAGAHISIAWQRSSGYWYLRLAFCYGIFLFMGSKVRLWIVLKDIFALHRAGPRQGTRPDFDDPPHILLTNSPC